MKKKLIVILLLFFLVFVANTSRAQAETTYVNPEREFRAAWISTFVGDVSSYKNETAFKNEMNQVLNIMEHYNLNAMIFHIRTHNNALYDSDLNPKAYWWANVNFDVFDPLEWLITECHKRGIEFHAWMNPYRVNSSLYAESLPAGNPANDQANLLSYNGNTILNPGLPNVRQFVIDTCLEVIEKYDVDAIHFDDYFYINLGANGATSGSNSILNEADQSTFEKYKGSYSTTKASDKADWRREQINLFIEGLHDAMTEYNQTHDRYVQLGISPTGIYKNGNGVVTYDSNGNPVTSGSQTSGQTHFSSYLFCDSLKWCVEGWIDYILPQSYWAQTHPAAGYEKVMGWWNKVVKNLDVNLYSGIGVYMADEASNTYGWKTNMNELLEQLTFVSNYENVKGASIYKFSYLRSAYNGNTSSNSSKQLANLGTKCWTQKVLVPEIKSMEQVNLSTVKNFQLNNHTLTWDLLPGAKFYALYRDPNNVTFSQNQLVAVVGGNINTWTDNTTDNYQYGIVPISYTNTLGQTAKTTASTHLILHTDTGTTQGTEVTVNNGAVDGTTIQKGFTRYLNLDSSIVDQVKANYLWTSSNEAVATINQSGLITALKVGTTTITVTYKNDSKLVGQMEITVYDKYQVKFIDWDNRIISTQTIKNGDSAVAPNNPVREGHLFLGWDQSFTNVNSDLNIHALYQIYTYEVKFIDEFGKVLSIQTVEYGKDADLPEIEETDYLRFSHWSGDNYTHIVKDSIVIANYYKINYSLKALTNNEFGTVKILDDEAKSDLFECDYGYHGILEAEANDGEFLFWVVDGKIISFANVIELDVTGNHRLTAYFAPKDKYAVSYIDSNMDLIDFVLVTPLQKATTTKMPPLKPGYTFTGWKDDNKITNHTFIYATYKRDTNVLEVTINNGVFKDTNESTKMVGYGEKVTIECNDNNFNYWSINNQKACNQKTYTFTVYQDLTITAVLNGATNQDFVIFLNQPIYDLSTNKLAFYGKFDNPLDYELLEVGILYVKSANVDPRNASDAKKVRILRYSDNNEFSVLFDLQLNQGVSVCFYAVAKVNDSYVNYYSNYNSFINSLD